MNRLAAAHVTQARLTGDHSGYKHAEGLLRRFLATNATLYNIEARSQLASVLLSQHRFQEGYEIAEEALARKQQEPAVLTVISDVYVESGRLKEAASTLQDLIRIAPGLAAYSRMADLTRAYGQADEAWVWYARARVAADSFGGEPAAWVRVMMADLAIKTGQYGRARTYCNEALEIVPDYYLALAYLARAAECEKDYEKARPLLRQVVKTTRSPAFMIRLAHEEDALGAPDQAEMLRDMARVILEVTVASGDIGHLRALALCLM